MTKLKTFLYSFKKSLLDSRYYKDLEKTSFWFSYKYLFFLLMLLLLFRSFQIGAGYLGNRAAIPSKVQTFERAVSGLYPDGLIINIANGKLSTNTYEPFAIDLPTQLGNLHGTHLLVVDTQGLAEDYPSYNTIALATEKMLIYPNSERNKVTPQIFYFSEVTQPFRFDRAMYNVFLSKFLPTVNIFARFIDIYVIVGLVLFVIFGAFFWANGQLLFLLPMTFVVWLIALLCKRRKPFWTIYRFGMHALTWPLLLSFIFGLLQQPFGGMYSLVFLVWMLLVVLGMKREKVV